jgi:hypothetical protein
MRTYLIATVLAPLLLSGCVAAPPPAQIAPAPQFDPIVFFSGHTEGRGTLKKILSRPYATLVHGSGTMRGATLLLDQTVIQGHKPPKHREWHFSRVGPGRYAGTLSDAPSGFTGDVVGNRLHLAFTMKGGLATEQWLTLAPDGRSAHNVMIVHKLGVRAAVLTEDIHKTD